MIAHNCPLPQHRYVQVWSPAVRVCQVGGWEPAIWFATSANTSRMLGCHLLLEDGATLWDVPLHFLREGEPRIAMPVPPMEAQGWDCYGDVHEWALVPFLRNLDLVLLDRDHQPDALDGIHTGLILDYVADGYSAEPGQHKVHQLIVADNGALMLLPQDRIVVREPSFTVDGPVRPVLRQSRKWFAE